MPQTLADLVRSYRSGAGMSQELLAERAGISARTIGDIETGFQASPRLITVMLIAQALDLPEADSAKLRAAMPRRRSKDGGAQISPVRAPLPHVQVIGRDRAIADIAGTLRSKDVRLLTLTGSAGVGKTSLALAAAAQYEPEFEEVRFVALAPVANPLLVPSAVAAELGLSEDANTPLTQALTAYIGSKRYLLVLDNFEHLIPAAHWLNELLAACPNVTALVTSRERLHLRIEHNYVVQPLDRPSALELFVQRAQAVNFDFALSDANKPILETIVERLEGLPLAIELAAPRLTLLPPQALLARLERRLPLLESGPRDLPERQQTMRNAIEWSYDLLSPEEQYIFRHTGAFSGGAAIDAACAAAKDTPDKMLALLAALVEKSLLSLAEDDEGEPRIGILELLREFALERLDEAGEVYDAFARMAKHFLAFATIGHEELKGANATRWIGRFEREHANIRAVLEWALREGELETGLRLAGMMWRFWWVRGYFSEGHSWYDRFLERVRSSAAGVSAFAEAKALQGKVMIMGASGDFTEGVTQCERAIALWREIGDEMELTISMNSMGMLLLHSGRAQEGRKIHEEALAIRRRIGDRFGVATSLGNLAAAIAGQGDYASAIPLCEESIDVYRGLENLIGLSNSLTKLGYILELNGDYTRASAMFEESLSLQLQTHDKANMIYSYDRLASVAVKLGRYDTAKERWRQAFDLLQTVTNKGLIIDALEGMMRLCICERRFAQAARLCGAAEAMRKAIHSPLWQYEIDEYNANVETIRTALGEKRFLEERRFGGASPLRQIVDDAFAVPAQ